MMLPSFQDDYTCHRCGTVFLKFVKLTHFIGISLVLSISCVSHETSGTGWDSGTNKMSVNRAASVDYA